jgi:hypothetical protein
LRWVGRDSPVDVGELEVSAHGRQASIELIERCQVFRQPDGLHIPAVQLLATAIRSTEV